MRVFPAIPGAFISLLLSSLLALSFCYADDKTVEVVGFTECADCVENNIKTAHAFSGLKVTIDCKAANQHFKTRGSGELDEEGRFKVSIPRGIVDQDGKLKEECFAQLYSATSLPCPARDGLQASKIIVLESKKETSFGLAGKLKFSPGTCVSAFFWHYPPLPKLPPFPKYPWHKSFPPLPPFNIPPFPPKVYPHPFPPKVFPPFPPKVFPPFPPKVFPPFPPKVFPPFPPKEYPPFPPKSFPPPVPIYEPPPTPKIEPLPPPVPKPPSKKPCPPKKKPVPPPKPPAKKPCPPTMKPKPPAYKPPTYKPPTYKPPVVEPPPTYIPPPTPIYKKPCPPLPELPPFPPKYFHHPGFGKFPPFPSPPYP